MIERLLFQHILKLILMMFVGFAAVKTKILKSEDSRVLSKLALFVIGPSAIISAFQVELNADVAGGLLEALIIAACSILFSVFAAKMFRKVFRLNTVEEASILFSNAGNLVIPLVSGVLGPEWVIYTTPFLAVQLSVMWSYGVSMFQKKGTVQWKKIFLNANLISIVIGAILMLSRIKLPYILPDALKSLASMQGPIAMIVTGMLAAQLHLKRIFTDPKVYLTVVLRVVAMPAIFLLFVKALMHFGVLLPGSYIVLIVFFAVMTPVASNVTQFSIVYGEDAEYASGINILSTLACALTMPVFVKLFFG